MFLIWGYYSGTIHILHIYTIYLSLSPSIWLLNRVQLEVRTLHHCLLSEGLVYMHSSKL